VNGELSYSTWEFDATYKGGTRIKMAQVAVRHWKNGQIVVLTDGTNTAYATSLAKSGTDVYVTGQECNGPRNSYPPSITIAKYWKNGVAINLTDGKYDAGAYSISISGDDVYIAGDEYILSSNGISIYVAKYWKNGVAVNLSDGSNDASAHAIVVVGSDVYVAGYDNKQAVLWKNGTPTILSSGKTAAAHSLAVSGSDVYVAGTQLNAIANEQAIYWKNGIPTSLTDGTTNVTANGIAISGNDVYVAGVERSTIISSNPVAKCWKNGEVITLQTPKYSSSGVFSVAVFGSDVYLAGYDAIDGSVYWKNGVRTKLVNGANGSASKIFLYPK